MIYNDKKTSLLVENQLPQFVRDNPDYANFSLFLKAYYEWLEQSNNALYHARNLLNYRDIDETLDEFEQYFYNELYNDYKKTDKHKLSSIIPTVLITPPAIIFGYLLTTRFFH